MLKIRSFVALTAALFASGSNASAQTGSPCGAPAYRGLAFTLGSWTITDSAGSSRGAATIAYALDGCSVEETWSAPDGHRGINIDAYSADDRRWHRLFVDNKGHVHAFTGTVEGTSIHYSGLSEGPSGKPVLNELLIDTLRPGAAMRQTWRQSDDGGHTWRLVFQDHYRLARG